MTCIHEGVRARAISECVRACVATAIATIMIVGVAAAQSNEPTYVLEGATADAKLGAYLATVPDVTGDGVDEFVTGNHRWDGPAGKDSGRVLLFDGATGAELWTVNGPVAGGLMGHNVWGIKDLNNDGKGDVIVSAYRLPFPSKPNAGKAWVLSGANGAVLWTKDAQFTGDEFGYCLSSVPDLDNDGRDDVIIGAWLNDETFNLAGKIYVYSGRTGNLIRTHEGTKIDHRFGCSAAGLNDLDNDGYGDYVIGSQHGGPNSEGEAYLYSGKTGTLLHTFTGENNWDQFSWSVARVDDTNGDGLDDIYMGARDFDDGPDTDAGKAYLFSGGTYSTLHTFLGENSYDKFGRYGTGIPDVDGDGYGDLAVGADHHWGNGITRTGAAYLYSGRTGQRLQKYNGEAANNMFGFAMCGLNDANGDGRGDVVIGAYQYKPNPNLTESYGRIYTYTDGLKASVTSLSASAGGLVQLTLDAGTPNKNKQYLLLASSNGSTPGFDIAGKRLPLTFDTFFLASWFYANTPLLMNTYGRLDSNSQSLALFIAPPGMLTSFIGLKLTFAYATLNLKMMSNPVAIEIVP